MAGRFAGWGQGQLRGRIGGNVGRFIERLHVSTSESHLMAIALEYLPGLLDASSVCIVSWDLAGARYECLGFSRPLMVDWLTKWCKQDRVFEAVMALHSPAHNLSVYSQAAWADSLIYVEFFRKFAAHHYLSVPLYGSMASLSGVINFYRDEGANAFDADDVAVAGVIAGYTSVVLGRLPQAPAVTPTTLTKRELEVARLAADGRNNLQIAFELGIARDTVKKSLGRVYEKLHVSGRAQMARQLTRERIL